MAAAAPRRTPTLTGGRLFLSGLFIFKEDAASLMGLRGNYPSGQTCQEPRARSEQMPRKTDLRRHRFMPASPAAVPPLRPTGCSRD
jgi:hypothetical protein